MMRTPILLLTSVALLPLATCAPGEGSPLLPLFEQAAVESGVPLDLLLAVAYKESRFSTRLGSRRRRPSAG